MLAFVLKSNMFSNIKSIDKDYFDYKQQNLLCTFAVLGTAFRVD